MSKGPERILFRGYIKKENGHWVAVCIDLNIVAQGSNVDDAIEKCEGLILEYLKYVCSEYKDDFYKHIQRPAPKEFVDEFNLIMGRQLKARRKSYTKNLQYYDVIPSNLPICAAQ